MKKHTLLLAAITMLAACNQKYTITPDEVVGERVQASQITEHAQWISVVDAPVVTDTVYDGSRAADGANWFMTSITPKKQIRKAVWVTTGLGVYDLFVNGNRVGTEVLKPGYTDYAKTKYSFAYDITDALNTTQGETNTLAAQVTPGWWADKIITPAGTKGMYGKKCAFRADLQITYTDGTMDNFPTDTIHWKAGIAGPVTHAAIFDGEEYDARIPMGYNTPEKLTTPEVNKEFNGEILPSNGAEVYLRYDLALAPQKAYVYSQIENADDTHFGKVVIDREYQSGDKMTIHAGETLVIDFGQNCAAVPQFIFDAPEGTVITFEGGELLNDSLGAHVRGMDGPEGSVHRTNLRIPETGVTMKYTFAQNDQPVQYHPRYTFFGYRYAAIKATNTVTIYALQSIPVSSITNEIEIGTITTGNELVNQLISNTLWGQRSNYLSVPTDCPQRNERLGWTADTQVFAETGTFFANTNAFFRKWLRDLRDTQKENGGYPGVAPFGQYGSSPVDMARVGWSDAGIIVPWVILKQFGDTELVKQHWTSMERYINHGAEVNFDHTALFPDNGGYQWADWLSYEALESFTGQPWDANGLRPEAAEYWSYLYGSYWIINTEKMIDMARLINNDTTKYINMLAQAKEYVTNRFLTQEGEFKLPILNTMQTPALFALRNKLLTGQAKQNMIDRLRQNFVDHNNCLQTGFLGTSILMQTLTENGMVDVAYELLFQRRNPSWLYSVDNGATTIWERWNSYTIEKGMAPNGMNSFNHYAYGCVCQWIWQTAAGINADIMQPGFKHIILKPVPDPRLGFLKAEYNSQAGLITSAWHYEGAQWTWTFSIPEATTATVILPDGSEPKQYTSGTYTLSLTL